MRRRISLPITLHVAQRGVVTLPQSIRKAYQLEAGDTLTLIDLSSVFVISPRRAKLDRLAGQIAAGLAERGESLESMLQAIREAREQDDR